MHAIFALIPLPLLAAPPEFPKLPKPFGTSSVVNRAKVIGWPEDRIATAPPGFKMTLFAADAETPRWFYQLPISMSSRLGPTQSPRKKADEKKAEDSPNRTSLYRDGKKYALLKDLQLGRAATWSNTGRTKRYFV
ncbi:hypothetical protein [Fimbriiglobus ruber]|uniref:L-sorbosone dehydrogenase n=1 Tax=Fimbriiglobus ruber TaxID=1908690 RepID=A0A225DS43_9BACT|nr:hypothetical protein [Fimbriiglobus ruber]OWK39215.1 L-sorbosone dehydrogenase [Fimbriiglobus ruber]